MSILKSVLTGGLNSAPEHGTDHGTGSEHDLNSTEMVLEVNYGYDGIPPKEAKAIKEDFSMCKHEIAHCDTMLESLASAPEQTKSEKLFKQRQLNAIRKKRSNKIKHFKRLNARLKALHENHKTGQDLGSNNSSTMPIKDLQKLEPILAQELASNDVDVSNSGTGDRNHHAKAMLISQAELPSTSGTSGNVHEAQEEASSSFHVDRSRIHALSVEQQDSELQQLGLTVYNQDEFEQGVLEQADEAYANAEIIQNKALEKEMQAIQDDVKSCQNEISNCDKMLKEMLTAQDISKESRRRVEAIKRTKENKLQHLKRLKGRQKALYHRMMKGLARMEEAASGSSLSTNQRSTQGPEAFPLADDVQSEQERMIRLGEMTPFGTVMKKQDSNAGSAPVSSFEKYLQDQSELSQGPAKKKKAHRRSSVSSAASASTNLSIKEEPITAPDTPIRKRTDNFFDATDRKSYRPAERDFSNYGRKRKLHHGLEHNFTGDRSGSDIEIGDEIDEDDYANQFADKDYLPAHERELGLDSDESYSISPVPNKKKKRSTKATRVNEDNDIDLGDLKAKYGVKKRISSGGSTFKVTRCRDDGSREMYEMRIREWRRTRLREKQHHAEAGDLDSSDESDMEFDSGFKVPNKIWKKLYRYQKTCIKWLWELHQQQCGGIIGDEMGLGKTIQVISFLVALKHSRLRDRASNSRYQGLGPVIVVCPITVMHQWVNEFHKWWPQFRVSVLHSSGSFTGKESTLVREVVNDCGVLITSYSHVVIHQDLLLKYDWHYIVLDEGHKIRNPDAQATIAVKQFRTCHRLILSGSPMQNNLKELWSLFDFVFPGKLGTLPDFMAHFSVPITAGGYANATQVQVTTAYKCACILRDTINPYLLRRMKADVKVALDLPAKNEQVLFCRLTQHQRDMYQEYLDSKECQQILRGNYMVFPGLITLRKVCNHPDLSTGGPNVFDRNNLDELSDEVREYGHFSRSGKLIVVESLLKIWHKQGHRVLLFTQGTQMMDILEWFVRARGYTYLRMDGKTNIASRQPLVHKFNEDKSIFVFLLTTRVGGLGVNLTGADRVVIFDPDWNPSTDTQARERAWRIGQDKQVTIYRLITTGTIEEKIYHRQIFKQFLTNRVLKDPKQRRFFKSNDLFELFTLGVDDLDTSTETSAIFAGTGSDVKVNLKVKSDSKKEGREKRKNRFDALREKHKETTDEEEADIDTAGNDEMDLDIDKLKKMKELARKLSQQMNAAKSIPSTKGSSDDKSQDNSECSAQMVDTKLPRKDLDKTNEQCSSKCNIDGLHSSDVTKTTELDNPESKNGNGSREAGSSHSLTYSMEKDNNKPKNTVNKSKDKDKEERRKRRKEKERKKKKVPTATLR